MGEDGAPPSSDAPEDGPPVPGPQFQQEGGAQLPRDSQEMAETSLAVRVWSGTADAPGDSVKRGHQGKV